MIYVYFYADMRTSEERKTYERERKRLQRAKMPKKKRGRKPTINVRNMSRENKRLYDKERQRAYRAQKNFKASEIIFHSCHA